MATMTDVTVVAANTRSANLLAGKNEEFVRLSSVVNLYCVASAAGLNVDFLIGNEAIVNDQECSGANRFPQTDTDLFARHGAVPGERLSLFARNTTAGAITLNTLVEVLAL